MHNMALPIFIVTCVTQGREKIHLSLVISTVQRYTNAAVKLDDAIFAQLLKVYNSMAHHFFG